MLFTFNLRAATRARIFLTRHPWLYWSVVGAASVAVGLLVNAELDALEAERAAWGETRPVLVATDDLVPDGPIAVTRASRPLAAIPPTALDELPDGARLHQRVSAGEVLVEADLVGGSGPARHAAPGTVVVGIVDPRAPAAGVGQVVRVASEGVVLAEQATVVDVVDEVIYVAVRERDGPAVAGAAASADASLLFIP